MSDIKNGTKPTYESPTVVPLGEMAKGSGACSPGSAVPLDCSAGVTATRDCTAGTEATRACTAGVAATAGCTAGGLIV